MSVARFAFEACFFSARPLCPSISGAAERCSPCRERLQINDLGRGSSRLGIGPDLEDLRTISPEGVFTPLVDVLHKHKHAASLTG